MNIKVGVFELISKVAAFCCCHALLLLLLFWLAFAGPAAQAAEPPRSELALVFADADGFGERMPQLPVYPAYRNGSIAGYAFFSADIMDSAGYSAKPMNVAIGLDLQGRIVGAHLVEHHEPILILGITDDHLRAFVAQYRNVDIREPVKLRSVAGSAGSTGRSMASAAPPSPP